MKVFALGDLHLSGSVDKPMCVFGPNWHEHFLRIEENWNAAVGQDDLVLIPGDISWGMNLEQAKVDLERICSWPGKKVLLRGNHDYWWSSLSKVRAMLDASAFALQNDAMTFGGVTIAGARGWTCPGSLAYQPEHEKIYRREVSRLELSLQQMTGEGTRIVMMHYPPWNERGEESDFTRLLRQYGAQIVVYGHLHGKSCRGALQGERGGIRYHLVSADYLKFNPLLIWETE